MRCKVSLVLEGFPLHVWDTTVVEDLLGKSCAVDAVAPETKARAYMSLFKLSAWTSDMEAIPVASMLAVPEPVPGGGARPALARTAAAVVSGAGIVTGEVRTLQYRVLIHVVRVEKDVSEELGHAHSAPGRGHGGPREASEGGGDGGSGGRGGGPRRVSRNLAWRRVVPYQQHGPGGATQCGIILGRSAAAPVPEKRSSLPGVVSPAPLTVQTGGSVKQGCRPRQAKKLQERHWWQIKWIKCLWQR
jgi:hypothetical protein